MSLTTRNIALSAAAFAMALGAHVASAQTTIVFDDLTSPGTFTSTGSTPHTQLGQIFNLGNTGLTTNPIRITGSDFTVAAQATASYTDVQVTQFFWGTASGATTGTTAAYSNLLGTRIYDLGAQSFTTGFVTTFNGGATSFNTPVTLTGLTTAGQIGFSELVTTNSGSGLVLNDNLLPAFVTNVPTVGSNALLVNAFPGYYRNAAGESNGNFIGSDARTLSANDFIAVRLYATAASPEPTGIAMLLVISPIGFATIRRRSRQA